MKYLSRFISLWFSTIALAGCSLSQYVESTAVDYNVAFADASNKLTLLNIARGRDGEPLHFTTFSQIRGNLSLSANGSFGPTFNGASAVTNDAQIIRKRGNTYGTSMSGGITTNPTFDIVPQSSEQFYRGIMTPITLELIDFYLNAGWNKNVIMYAMVESVVLNDANGNEVTARFSDNYYQGETVDGPVKVAHQLFAQWVECNDFSVLSSEAKADVLTPKLSRSNFETLNMAAIEMLYKNNMVLMNDDPTKNDGPVQILKARNLILLAKQSSKPPSNCPTSIPAFLDGRYSVSNYGAQSPGTLTTRSPRAVMYFLGELARARTLVQGALWQSPNTDQKKKESLAVFGQTKSRCKGSKLKLNEGGKKICIPDEELIGKNRTFQLITLVQQLIGLSQKSDDLPRTNAVAVIN